MVRKEENNLINAINVITDGRQKVIIKQIIKNTIISGYLGGEHYQKYVLI